MDRLPFSIALACAVLACTGKVHAADPPRPTARFKYVPPDPSLGCPDEQAVRDAVVGRLGYMPFSREAPRKVVARIERGKSGLVADVELLDIEGEHLGGRHITSASRDCRELAEAMELAISIAVDPLVVTKPPPSPAPSSPPPLVLPPEASVEQAPPRPVAHKPSPLAFRASVGGLVALGAAPTVAGGLDAQLGLRWRFLSVNLEGRFDIPAADGNTETRLALGGVAPCGHWRFLMGCALVLLGTINGAGQDISAPRRETSFYAGLGLRLGAEIKLVKVLYLRLHGDLLGTLVRTSFQIDGVDQWVTPPVSGAFGVALLVSYP